MEHNEMKMMLIEHYKEEIEDVYEYAHLAEEAEEIGEHSMAKCLYAIAEEEYSHAYALRKRLVEDFGYGPHADTETEKRWKAIKKL